tara:strand:- start:10987 stop:11223 length:237 start_codon:yes stop_codon:yes gene_type:complete
VFLNLTKGKKMELPSTQDFMISIASRLTKIGGTMKELSKRTTLSQASLSNAKCGYAKFTFEKANMINKVVTDMESEAE